MAWGEPGYEIEDKIPSIYDPAAGAMRFPGTRSFIVVPSDATDGSGTLPFRCRYYKASQDGLIKVRTASGQVQYVYALRGENHERIDQVYALDFPEGMVVEIWD